MIHSIWDDEAPPDFLWDYQRELQKYTAENEMAKPIDGLSWIIFDFATLRAKIRYKQIGEILSIIITILVMPARVLLSIKSMAWRTAWRMAPSSENIC